MKSHCNFLFRCTENRDYGHQRIYVFTTMCYNLIGHVIAHRYVLGEAGGPVRQGYTNPAYRTYSDYLETWSPYRASDQVALISMPNKQVNFRSLYHCSYMLWLIRVKGDYTWICYFVQCTLYYSYTIYFTVFLDHGVVLWKLYWSVMLFVAGYAGYEARAEIYVKIRRKTSSYELGQRRLQERPPTGQLPSRHFPRSAYCVTD